MRWLLVPLLFAASLLPFPIPPFTPGAAAQPAPVLVFTAIPDQDASRLAERFGRVAALLRNSLGVAVRYLPVKSYPAAITAFANNEAQLGWFGGFTGVQARAAVPGSRAIAQGEEDRRFKTFFIANAATGLAKGDALDRGIAGRSFTFGARASTSGRLMPEFFIRQAFGKAPDDVFGRVGFSGDHTRTIQLVQSGAYELGAVDYSVWELERRAGRVDDSKVKVIWESPPFPDYQWTVRGDVDARFGAGFTERLARTLVAIDDPKILEPFARSKFVPADNGEYRPIEDVARQDGLLN